MGIRIDTQTLVEQHAPVTALPTADEKNEVVFRCKIGNVRHSVCHITANGVETLKRGFGRDVLLDILDDAVKLVKRFRGLGIEIDITREIEFANLLETLYDNGCRLCLSHQSQDLGVTFLSENDNLAVACLMLTLDFSLELEHHRTGGVNNLNMIATSQFVGLGRSA